MLPRVQFYSICCTFGVGVLLIYYANNTITHNRPCIETAVRYDGSPEIKKILEKIRSEIKYELNKYNFSETGAHRLEDLVMESGGRPLHSLIISTWRSGTTFLAEILNTIPGSYYHYEPLHMYGVTQIRGPPVSDLALSTILNLLKCNYEGLADYLKSARYRFTYQFTYNTRLWNHCEDKRELCFNALFTSRSCKLFPFQIMKIVRLRLRLIQEIWDDKELNMKVILLIRDPRGVMNSRQNTGFCKPYWDCWEPSLVCADMISDYVAASRIQKQYPADRLMVLRYEELALNLNYTTHRILKFLRLSATQSFYEYLQSHTNKEVAGVESTSRISRDKPFRWKNALHFKYVDQIQRTCKKAMFLWGYKMAHNETHMKSKDFNPIDSKRFNPIHLKRIKS